MEQNNNAAVIAVIEYVNVFGTEYLRIGDEVVMNMDKEARGWGRKGVPDGSKGTVMGFYEYYDARNMNRDKVPGIYRGNGAAYVKWEDGSVSTEGSDIAMPKHIVDERRIDTVHNEAFKEKVKLYDLPKFEYMVGNKVAYTWRSNASFNRHVPQREIGVITNIDFDDIIDRRTGELLPMEKWHTDRILHVDIVEGGSTRVSVAEVDELIEQGNYWAWLNDKTQLKFKDLQEECGFYASLGKRQQVRSPRSGNYKWLLDDAVEAVRRGDIDGLGSSGSWFGSTPFPTTYKLDEDLADLAQRLRTKTVEGWADHVVGERPKRKYSVSHTIPGTEFTIFATKEFDDSVHIAPPDEHEVLVLDGCKFTIKHSYRMNEPEDESLNLLPMFEKQPVDLGKIDAALTSQFFGRLEKAGWSVDKSFYM